MKVLITNNTLSVRAGSELCVRDLAASLLSRGHTPIAYSTVLGEVARELRDATVPVVDDLNAVGTAPDIIHGQHHLETMTALLHFPGVPAIYHCHGWLPWEEAPPRFPRILRYIAVDYTCRDRIILENGVPEDRVSVLLNWVDIEKFTPRPPLPATPRRALVFSNNASEQTYVAEVREACRRSNIHLDVLGSSAGNSTSTPELVLREYDIVFAKAKSALEALAVGTSVILCDATGLGRMVTIGDLAELRALNFGIRALRQPVRMETLAREISRYDPADAARVSDQVRATAGMKAAVDSIVSLYDEVISEFASIRAIDQDAEARAASAYLRWLSPRFKEFNLLLSERDTLAHERDALTRERDHLLHERGDLSIELNRLQSEVGVHSRQLTERDVEIGKIKGTVGWRLLSKWGRVKYRLVLPARDQLKKLLGMNRKSL